MDNNVDLTTEYQNLNSGNRRMNGLNSSFARVGKDGPESSKLTYTIIWYWNHLNFKHFTNIVIK